MKFCDNDQCYEYSNELENLCDKCMNFTIYDMSSGFLPISMISVSMFKEYVMIRWFWHQHFCSHMSLVKDLRNMKFQHIQMPTQPNSKFWNAVCEKCEYLSQYL